MGYVADIWSVLRGRAVVVDEAVEDSLAHLLLSLEKRAATVVVADSISGKINANKVSVDTLLNRIATNAAGTQDFAALGIALMTLDARLPDGVLATLLARIPASALATIQQRIPSAAARQTSVQTLLDRLTSARAGYLDSLNGFTPIKQYKSQTFTASGTWVRPAGVDVVWVTMIGGGGAGDC